ncbi:MAG: UbiD family decarboxylase [Chloroflexi bacterium]|nr:UbiD family decarboxylase [Chloroflexota bacterium]
MPFNDLREFLAFLEEQGEIKHVPVEVDWNQEMGAISRIGLERKLPALVFEKVKDYPGCTVVGNLLGPTRPVVQGRIALAMGLPKDTPTSEIIKALRGHFRQSIPPRLVSTGPCKENIIHGSDINLLDFPVPYIHSYDGGRYFGTWSISITKDPDNGWVNWGTYRHMLHDSRRIGWLANPGQHGPGHFYQKYEARGKAMPMAIVIGADPACHLAATTQLPPFVDEREVAGAIRGAPVDLVKCETIDLEVPATAEIVVEGHVLPGERLEEGPFGEWTGYYASDRLPRPVFRAECVTFRNNPIFCFDGPGKPWDVSSNIFSVAWTAVVANDLEERGVEFVNIYAPPPQLGIFISVKSPYAGYAHLVASAFWSSKTGIYRPFVYIVGEDVDVTNPDEILWCLQTRLHPVRGIHVQTQTMGNVLHPFLNSEEQRTQIGAKAYFDATFPVEWGEERTPKVVDFEHAWTPEIQRKVLERLSEYGID